MLRASLSSSSTRYRNCRHYSSSGIRYDERPNSSIYSWHSVQFIPESFAYDVPLDYLEDLSGHVWVKVVYNLLHQLIHCSVHLRTNLPSLSSNIYILSFYIIAAHLGEQNEARLVINKWIESGQNLTWHDSNYPQPDAGKVECILFDTVCCALGKFNCEVSTAEWLDEEDSEVELMIWVFKQVQSRVQPMDQLASEAEQLSLWQLRRNASLGDVEQHNAIMQTQW